MHDEAQVPHPIVAVTARRGARAHRLRSSRPGRRPRRRTGRAHHVDALRRQPRRAGGLRADHLRLQRLAGPVRGGPARTSRRAPTTTRSLRRRRRADLPCLLDMDGPIMPNWAWAGYLQPLGLPDELTDSLLPTPSALQGHRSTRPATGTPRCRSSRASPCWTANGIRIPTVDEPWTQESSTRPWPR